MEPTEELAAAVGLAACQELRKARERIEHCLGQLDDEQVWSRPSAAMNSIGNLILHLCGNLRQWVVAGLGGDKDVRNRPSEFSQRAPIPKDQLLRLLEDIVGQAERTLDKASAQELLRRRSIQGFDVTGLEAIFDSVPHFRGHTQEIIHMTRGLRGDAYQFAWQPTTPEQGAP